MKKILVLNSLNTKITTQYSEEEIINIEDYLYGGKSSPDTLMASIHNDNLTLEYDVAEYNVAIMHAISDIGTCLNSYYGVTEDKEYWNWLMSYWMKNQFIEDYYCLYLIEKIILDNPGIKIVCLDDDYLKHYNLRVGENVDLSVVHELEYSLIFSRAVWQISAIKHCEIIKDEELGKYYSYDDKTRVEGSPFFNFIKMAALSRYSVRGNYELRTVDKIRLYFSHIYSPDNLQYNKKEIVITYDKDKREEIFSTFESNNNGLFEQYLYKWVIYCIPCEWVEGYKKNLVNSRIPKTPNYFYAPKSIISNPYKRLMLAQFRKNGCRVFSIAGSVGWNHFKNNICFDLADDIYLFSRGGISENMARPKCVSIIPSGKREDYLLYLGSGLAVKRYYYYIEYMSNKLRKNHFDDMCIFLSNIDFNEISRVAYKSRDPGNTNIALFVKSKFPKVEIVEDSRKGFMSRNGETAQSMISRARMVVLESLTTAALVECLLQDTPFLVIDSSSEYMDDEDYFRGSLEMRDVLIDAHILFFDAYEAATYINHIYNQIEEWWDDDIRKNAIEWMKNSFFWLERRETERKWIVNEIINLYEKG